MTSSLGLVELLLVLLGVMGWGAYELWSLRGDKNRKAGRNPGDKRRP